MTTTETTVTELRNRTRLRRWLSQHRESVACTATGVAGLVITPNAGSGETYWWAISTLVAFISVTYLHRGWAAARQGR